MDTLVPGVKFAEGELELDQSDDGIEKKSLISNEHSDDDLGSFKCYKLNKFERVVISNLNKDIEPFLYQFKLMSKLMRSCQILNEVKPNYEDSPFRMDNTKPLGFVPLNEFVNLVQPNESVLNVLFGMRCINKPLRNELGKLFGHLLFQDERSVTFCKSLISNLNEDEFYEVPQYEQILFHLFTMQDHYSKERADSCLNLFSKVIDNNSSEFAFTDNI